jgi:hypothetical protein
LIKEYVARGLGNCQNVATLKQELAQINFDKYKDKYPSYLFFTDEQFSAIVERNKLVTSTIEAYTGHVPDDCFDAVKNESIDKEDLRDGEIIAITISYYCADRLSTTEIKKETAIDFASTLEHVLKIKNGTKEDFEKFNLVDHRMVSIDHSMLGRIKNPSDLQILRFMYGGSYNPDDKLYGTKTKDDTTIKVDFESEDFEKLYIAAPAEKIDKTKKKESKFFRAFSITKQEQPKDPIVFRYVKDGILVITFWK